GTSERPGLSGSPSWCGTVAYGPRTPSAWLGRGSSLQATRGEVRAASPPLGITPSISRQRPRRAHGSCGALEATAAAPSQAERGAAPLSLVLDRHRRME